MAKAIDYVPEAPERIGKKVNRLEIELAEHADAIVAAIAVLEEAHKEQFLDLLRGAMGARSAIASLLAELGSEATSVNATRNLIVLLKALGAIDPSMVSKASANVRSTLSSRASSSLAPSLWQIFKQANRQDVRRGISLMLEMAGALGRAVE